MSEWISVEDRLPEAWNRVFCRVQIQGDYPCIVHFEGYYNKSCEWIDWCGDTGSLDGWSVTHWQPLPAPPSKEDDEKKYPKHLRKGNL